ncbi:MAG: hypothetical protein OES79_10600, partial [Planctomycetota bacterium]|nr:hypothetical protein [Planctomycetota bacterium]
MNPILAETPSDHELPARQPAGVRWSLIREIGLDYAPGTEGEAGRRLRLPSFATRADDGKYWIVDELGVDKLVPYRFECRTICVNEDHEILYDTMQHGIHDGYGCPLEDGCVAVLRRTRWDLLVMSPRGKILDRYGLETFSKRTPRLVSRTPAGTFLIVFLDRAGQFDAVEVDRRGRLVWFLPARAHPIGVPASVQLLPSDTLLFADPFRHVALELDRAGNVVWQFGEAGKPSRQPHQLSSPGSVRCLPDGTRLIADTRNHRLLVIGVDGTPSPVRVDEGNLCDPSYAEGLTNGHYLICDAGNRRVIEIDGQGRIVWQYGRELAKQRFLSYPRSVELTSDGHYLVADTAHDRIVEFGSGRFHEKPFYGEPALFWPRCVRALPGGSLLIADGRNCRIVEVSREGHVSRELREV